MSEVNQAEASTRAAAANLALAEDNLRRTEALVKTNSLPEAQAEQARQQVALMKAQLEGAQASASLARTGAGLHTIAAPFKGIVTKAPTSAGGVVQPGSALLHVEDVSQLRLSATVGEDDVPLVAVGAPVVVTYKERSVPGKVVAVVPSLDQATRRAPIEIEVPNATADTPLLGWSFVRAQIEGGAEVPALKVPATARRPGSQDELIQAVAGKVHVVHVTHAETTDGFWIVRQGLVPDAKIVESPDAEMKEGDPLEIAGQP
jgi:membrane fusion protein (multidrug efflux system)